MKYLVIQDANWADEFDCQKYNIFPTKQGAQDFVDGCIENGGYFGTNEGWEEGDLSSRDFRIECITELQAEVLIELLGESFGTGL
jgi:hypothetical protein